MVKATCIWFFGLSGAGKTTIANKLRDKFLVRGLKVQRLDGDVVRKILTKDLGFSMEDRFEHIRRVVFVAKLLMKNGINVVASFITPLKSMRYYIKQELGEKCLLIECRCGLQTCIERDVKGLYAKALNGIIKDFTGLTQPYERGGNEVFWVLNTEDFEPKESLKNLVEKFKCFKVFERLMKDNET